MMQSPEFNSTLFNVVRQSMRCDEMFIYPNKPIRIYDIEKLKHSIDFKAWIVQPKWDGHRAIIACDESGKVQVFSRHKTHLRLAGDQWTWLNLLPFPRPWLVDGELLHSGRLVIWDYAIWGGAYLFNKPYSERLKELETALPNVLRKGNKSTLVISQVPANRYKEILLKKGDKELEGIIFKNPQATDFWGPYRTREVPSQFKYRF